MPMNKFTDFLKKNKSSILVSFFVYVLFSLVFSGILTSLIYSKRAELFDYFAKQYIADVESKQTDQRQSDGMVFSEEATVVNIIEKANPAVVSIVISKDVPVIERYYENFNPFGGNDFFNDFFGNGSFGFRIPQYREKGTEKREVGGGSGFFVSSDGLLITNRHVVDDEDAEYTVLTNDGEKYDAKVLARDSMLDVAVLKVNGKNFPFLEFGNSDILKQGQKVIAIGNALAEFRNSVSVGVVSGLSRSILAGDLSGKSEFLEGVIQTDAAINPGNSGGPLLNLSGKVIGVNVAVQKGAENIGFALPSNTVKSIAESVKKYGEIIRPYLGVRYIQITKKLKEKNNLPVDYGVLVVRGDKQEELAVIPGSPADIAGIVENDIILSVDGVKLKEGKSLAYLIRQKNVGDTIELKILSKGKEKTLTATLKKAP